MTAEKDKQRIDRIRSEVTERIPKRIYADDAMFLLALIEELTKENAELKKRLSQ